MILGLKHLLIFISSIVLLANVMNSKSYAVHELFRSIDENADGRIDHDEFETDMLEHAFDKLDDNHNKAVSQEEWKSLDWVSDPKKHDELFQSIDKNKDKRISFLEFSDYAERHSNIDEAFMGLDKDGSNNLSPDEITVRPLFKMITIRF